MTGREKPAARYALCRPCGKRAYLTRKVARAAARAANRGPMQAYPCPNTPEGAQAMWHVGHMPQVVRQGLVGKDKWLKGRR